MCQQYNYDYPHVHTKPPQEYATIFAGAGNNPGEKSLEDKFFEKEVHIFK